MSRDNPTALRVGATGQLDGRRYTVAGRVVLSVQVDGETYYWNEFNLTDPGGGAITLVYEETDEGSPWKIFRLIEPLRPLSVPEAKTKGVGDKVSVDSKNVRITLVNRSRVVHIEGRAPEGVETGDLADFFNAEGDDGMFVASWTGDEIEYFQGQTVPAARIEGAFNLPRSSSGSSAAFSGGGGGSGLNLGWVVLALMVFFGFSAYSCNRDERSPAPRPKQAAPSTRLPDGGRCLLAGRGYQVAGHALVEVATVRGNYERHEYDLADDTGHHFLLVNSLGGDAHQWHLLAPVEPPAGFTPYDAAALRQGGKRDIAGRPMQVIQLFMVKVRGVDGRPAATVWPDQLQYGLMARQEDEWLVARWTETNLQIFAGRTLEEKDVLAGFAAK